MRDQGNTKRFLFSIGFAFLHAIASAASSPLGSTPVEHESQWWPGGQGDDSLGTMAYRPSAAEQPFFDRLPPDEIATGSHDADYELSNKDGKYVGWFGIVRGIEEDAVAGRTVLVVEHKYFDGLTDAHLLSLSFNGAGDFQATLTGTGHRIPPLSLVKVYGTVAPGKAGTLPRLEAVFVRSWHWGTFTFLAAYGQQRGNEEWRKANQIPLDEIYDAWPHPCHHYYEERLGKRPDTAEIRERLLAAAGPVSPEARLVLERLADLLAVGHTWSEAETLRQWEELSDIRKTVGTTGSQPSAIELLLQALQENDERFSWSASEKFAAFDLAGDAIARLAELLDHESLRVQAGAARALGSGYGAKAAPAAIQLGRFVAASNEELQQYAILALGEIGPAASAAVPALKGALTQADPSHRAVVAEALWKIDQQPDDVIPALVTLLESGDVDQRSQAADQLEAMGPWAAAAVPALTKALADEEWTNRCNVAEALGKIGPQAAAAIPALTIALQEDEDSFVRSSAAEALGEIGSPIAIPALVAALTSDESVRFSAIEALETFGPQASAAIPALERIVENDEKHCWFAASALGAIDTEGISTRALIQALGDQNPTMRQFAALGLKGIGRKAADAEGALHDALGDADQGARIAAAEAYWSVSGEAEEAVQVLRSVLQESDGGIECTWAADGLAEIGPEAKEAVPELVVWLKSGTGYVVTSSVTALGRIGPAAASAEPALAACLRDSDDGYTRVLVAIALWRINRSEESLPVLQDALENSGDSMAVSEAARAIGEMDPPAKELVPLLRTLLKNSDSFVRNAAAKALEQIEPQ